MSSAGHNLSHLSPAAAGLGHAVAQPRMVAIASIVGLAALGWLWLGLVAAQEPGWLSALCRPQQGAAAWNASEFAVVLMMWCAMVLAMMLPSAAPMILTYTEIADTAARQSKHVVSPFVLVSGYTLVWLGFAGIAALVHSIVARAGLIEAATAQTAIMSGGLFIAAGLYQFSSLKHACLRLCRQPFQFFFTNWATTPRGVLRLGLRQGLYCLGCCWAMMVLMFAVGTMNVLWVAGLGAVMTIEKFSGMERFSRATGIGLVAIGAAFMLSAVWAS